MADRNTYLKMMLNNGKTQNSSIPDVKDYVANLGLNDEDIADFLIKNNEINAKQILTESQQQLQTQDQSFNQEKEEDKNWWQNIVDGMASIGNSVIDGIMNFADDIGDFFISVGDWMMGGNNKWADEAINYDWQAQVTNALNFMQPLLQGGDVTQNYNDWAQSVWQGGDTSRDYLNGIVEGTWTDNDFGKFLRDAANSIGYMLPTIAVGVLTGGSSAAALSTMGVVAGMGQTSDAYQENNNMGLALLSGIVAGGIEAGTEAIGGFIPGSKTITKTTIKALGKQMLEEGAEEVVSGFLQPVVDSIAKGNAEPWFDENGQFVYFSPEFWFTGEDSVARQGALGAFTGGVFGGANIVQNRIKYGKAGQQFGQAYQEFIETRNEARELKSKNKSTDAIEQKLGEASVYLAEKANQLKTAIENGTISNRQVKNLGEMLHNPTSNRNLLAENLNENINKLNNITNLNEHILRDLVSDFNISNNSNFKLDVVDNLKDVNGNSVNAQFNENTNTISLNSSILDNNAYSVLGHELLAHGVLDNILTNSNTRSLVFNLVNNDTEWVNQNKQAILKEYNTTENSEIYKSELVANYLQEKLINNNSLSDLELLASNRGVFKEFINSAKLIMENTNSSKLKQQIRKAVRQFGKSNYRVNSIVLKMVNDKKLNSKEQEYYDQNKTLFDAYFGIINSDLQVAYSKDTTNKTKEEISKKAYENLNKYSDYEKRILNNNYNETLDTFEELKEYVKDAIDGKDVATNGLLGKINKNLSDKIKVQTGLNVEDFNLAYNKIDLKHIYNRHIKNDANRIKISFEDIFLFPSLLSEADTIINEQNNNGGNYLVFKTDLGDLYLTVAVQSTKNKRLALKTIYITKKGAGSSVGNIETNSTLPFTSETSSEASSPLSVDSMTQNENNVNNNDKNKIKYSRNLTNSENDLLDKEFDNSIQDLSKEDTEQFKKIRKEAKRFVDILETTKPTFDNINEQEVEYIVNTAPLKSSSFTNTNDLEQVRKNVNNIFSNNLNYFADLLKIKVIENNDTQGYWLSDTTGKNMREISNQMIVKGKPSLVSVYGSLLADLAYQPQDSVYIDNYINADEFNNIPFEEKGFEFTVEVKDKTIDEITKILEDNNIQYATITNDKKLIIKEYGAFADSNEILVKNAHNMLNKLSNIFKDANIRVRRIKHYDNNRNVRENVYGKWLESELGRQYGGETSSSFIRSNQETTNTRKQGQEGLIKRPTEVNGEVIDKYNVVQRNNNTKNEVDINVLETNKANKVKENANKQLWQKVISFKDAKIAYNSLIDFINNSLNIDLTVKNKDTKIRALFDSYNVNEINNTLNDFSKDLLNSKVYQGVETTLREIFEANDFDTVKLENAITKSLKNILDNKAKTSETTKIFNNLQSQLLKAVDLINRYKNRARQFASLYKKVENIKKQLKIENNNTKLTDIKLDEVNLLKYLVSGRVFTKDGGISGTWRTRFNDLMKEDVNYFSSLYLPRYIKFATYEVEIFIFDWYGGLPVCFLY